MVADLRSGLVLTAVTAWRQVLQLGPYVAGGVVLAAFLGQFELPQRWRGWLGRSDPLRVVGAACLGSASPISSYGTVPVLLQLLRDGASPGPVLAFLAASSMLNPQLFLLVLGGLGVRIALAQAVGVLLLSAIAGLAAARLWPAVFLHPVVLSVDTCVSTAPGSFSWSRLGRKLLQLTGWVGLTFVTGVIVAATLQVFVPTAWVTRLLGNGHWLGVLLAGVLGVPLYACGGSTVPLLAGLTQMGMAPGAALAFLLSGPATRVMSLAAVGSLLSRRALAAYVAFVVAGATLLGLLLA